MNTATKPDNYGTTFVASSEYACGSCGGVLTIGTPHYCKREFSAVRSFPNLTVDQSVIDLLERIAIALEKLALVKDTP